MMSVSCEITDDSRRRTTTRLLMHRLHVDQAGMVSGLGCAGIPVPIGTGQVGYSFYGYVLCRTHITGK